MSCFEDATDYPERNGQGSSPGSQLGVHAEFASRGRRSQFLVCPGLDSFYDPQKILQQNRPFPSHGQTSMLEMAQVWVGIFMVYSDKGRCLSGERWLFVVGMDGWGRQ